MQRIGMLALVAFLATPLAAQTTVPPAAPTIGASAGFGGGIAIPIGRLSDTHAAGYTLAGLIDFSAAEQPFSFRAEVIYQRYDVKSAAATTGERSMNMTSFGASLLGRSPGASSRYLIGGIAVYRMTDQGTKPGVNVLTEGRPAITIPITLGARF